MPASQFKVEETPEGARVTQIAGLDEPDDGSPVINQFVVPGPPASAFDHANRLARELDAYPVLKETRQRLDELGYDRYADNPSAVDPEAVATAMGEIYPRIRRATDAD